jgi:bacterioferritin B
VAAPAFVEELSSQIGRELSASHQYLAVALYYDGQTLPQVAAFFYRQAMEERDHALMMVQYLLDAGEDVTLTAIDPPKSGFADIVEPVAIALEQERRVTDQISSLTGTAREANDFVSEQFMQWFLKEQVEEVATMSDLLAVAERSRDRPAELEDYIAREHSGSSEPDPTAPPVAGGGA